MSRLRITRALLLLLAMMASTVMMADGVQPSTKNIGGKTYYAIQTAQHLVWFRDQVNNNGQKSINAELENDIDLSTVCGPNVGNWIPIAKTISQDGLNETDGWTGIFKGNNHIISNLYINSNENYQALFGIVNGTIENLTVSGSVTLNNNGNYYFGGCGAIVVVNAVEGSSFSNVKVKGSVNGSWILGGIVAVGNGTFTDCLNQANITFKGVNCDEIGGIAGRLFYGTAKRCVNEGKIEAVSGTTANTIGGLVGNLGGSLDDCVNKGEIHCDFDKSGAFAGIHNGAIRCCLNLGHISTKKAIGAINMGSIQKSYSLEGTTDDNYYVTIASKSDLLNGKIVDLLNDGRINKVWVQSGAYPALIANPGSANPDGGTGTGSGENDERKVVETNSNEFKDLYVNTMDGSYGFYEAARYDLKLRYRPDTNKNTFSIGNEYRKYSDGTIEYVPSYDESGKYEIYLPTTISGMTISDIGKDAFCDSKFTKIIFDGDGTINKIDGAFRNCKNLLYISAKSVKTVTNNAFEGCDQLTSIPAISDEISNSAFKGCTGLSGDIELNAKTIKGSVFDGCSNISTIRLTQNVTSVSDNAFSGLNNLPALDMSKSKVPSGSFGSAGGSARSGIALAGVSKSTLVYLPNGVSNTDVNCVNLNGTTYTCSQLELTDTHEFINLYSFTANKLSLDRTFTPNANSTVYLPFALAEADAKNLGEFYQFMGYSGGIANFCSISAVIANTPFLFKPKVNKIAINHSVSVSASNVAGTGGQFTGTYKKIVWPTAADVANKYGYASTSSNGVAVGTFVRFGAGSWCNPFRAYLNLSDSAPAKINVVFNGETTGINEINSENEDGRSYNLAGQLVGKSYKGIVIKNGKKVLK